MTAPNLLAAICGLNSADPQLVTLIFDIPVASASYITGVSMTINGLNLPIVSAAVDSAPYGGGVVLTLGGGPAYTGVLTVSYNASVGDWNNASTPVASFTSVPVVNGSTVGRPPTDYPLSSIITQKVVASGGGFTGTVIADLNMVDSNLVSEYAPVQIDFGGTYGGYFLPQNLITLVNGLSVSQTFPTPQLTPAAAAAAALAWETANAQAIGNALAALRTTDAGVSFGGDVIAQY